MPETDFITVRTNRKEIDISIRTILYVFMNENIAEVHVAGGKVYKTRVTLETFENLLGDRFIKVHRSCLVSITAIHDITDKINLSNGEKLNYVVRRKKELIAELREKRMKFLENIDDEGFPHTEEEYHEKFRSFDNLPIAFTDIEMILDDKQNAVDWIFRYGNPALAKLEKTTLEKIIGTPFSVLFPNMDPKWLRGYERAALYGETLEIIDYSPEIDAYLDIICFPTGEGHCGCILLNIGEMSYASNYGDVQNARLKYMAKLLENIL